MNWFQRAWHRIRSGGFSSFGTVGHNRAEVDRDDRALLRLYEQNPNLYAVGNVIARDVARVNWRVFKVREPRGGRVSDRICREIQRLGPDKRGAAIRRRIDARLLEEQEGHAITQALTRGNQFMIGSAVRELIQIYLEMNGIVFVGVADAAGGATGDPAQLLPFPSFALNVRDSTEDEFIFRFVGSNRQDWRFPRERVLTIRKPRPTNPYELTGASSGRAVATEIAIDENAATTVNTRFKNRGRAEILVVGKGMSRAGVATLEASLNQPGGAMANSGAIKVTNPPEDLHIERFDEPLGDMSLLPIRQTSGELIRRPTGVPPEKLGILENSNRATIQEANFFHSSGVVDPRAALLEEVYNCHLLPMFQDSEDLVLLYDSVIPDDEDFALAVTTKHPRHFSRNEIRKLAGAEPTELDEDNAPPASKVDPKQVQTAMQEIVLPFTRGELSEESALAALTFFLQIPEAVAKQLLTPPPEEETEEPAGDDDTEDEDQNGDEEGNDEGDETGDGSELSLAV